MSGGRTQRHAAVGRGLPRAAQHRHGVEPVGDPSCLTGKRAVTEQIEPAWVGRKLAVDLRALLP